MENENPGLHLSRSRCKLSPVVLSGSKELGDVFAASPGQSNAI